MKLSKISREYYRNEWNEYPKGSIAFGAVYEAALEEGDDAHEVSLKLAELAKHDVEAKFAVRRIEKKAKIHGDTENA